MLKPVSSSEIIANSALDPRAPIEEHFVHKMGELVGPFFERLQLTKAGRALEAVSMKPSNIWYANAYCLALKELGDTPVPVKEGFVPASALHKKLRDGNNFYMFLGDPLYWRQVRDDDSITGYRSNFLEMKENVNPAQAFTSFQKRLSFLDCSVVIELAVYLTILERVGEECFNRVVTGWNRESPIRLESLKLSAHLTKVIRVAKACINSIDGPFLELQLGQKCYMRNHPNYVKKHDHGDAAGFSLVYIGNNLFRGLGLPSEGLELRKIAGLLHEAYNQAPIAAEDILSQSSAQEFHRRGLTFHCVVGSQKPNFTLEELEKGAAGESKKEKISTGQYQQLLNHARVSIANKADLVSHQIPFDQFLRETSLFVHKELEMRNIGFYIIDEAKVQEHFHN